MFETIVNADGTISIVPVTQNNNLPFNVGERLFNEFNNASAVPNITTFDPRSIQSIFPSNFPTGITAYSAAIPFEQDPIAIAQGFVKGSPSDASFPGTNFQFLPSANEADETDVVEEKKRSGGLADLFRALFGFFVPGANLLMGGGSRALQGIKSLNQRLRNTDFAKSRTLADYFATRRNRKFTGLDDPQGGAITTFRNVEQQAQDKIDDRGRGQIITRTPKSTRQIAPQSGMQAERTRTRDLGRMRGAIGR